MTEGCLREKMVMKKEFQLPELFRPGRRWWWAMRMAQHRGREQFLICLSSLQQLLDAKAYGEAVEC
jgi:hypothetical protein